MHHRLPPNVPNLRSNISSDPTLGLSIPPSSSIPLSNINTSNYGHNISTSTINNGNQNQPLQLPTASVTNTPSSSNTSSAPSNEWINRKQTFDILGIIGYTLFTIFLQTGAILQPKQRYFYLHDTTLRYPYIPEYSTTFTNNNNNNPSSTSSSSIIGTSTNTTVTITQNILWMYSILVPLLCILFIDSFIRRTNGNRTIQRLYYAFFGGITVILICTIIQISTSTLTPDFQSRCRDTIQQYLNSTTTTTSSDNPIINTNQCMGDTTILLYGRMSFPNLVAALTTYSMIITSVYIYIHIYIPNSQIWPVLFQTLPLFLGLYAAVSPYSDYRAHGIDIFCGIIIGLLCSIIIQYKFLGQLKRSYYGEDPTEIAEFLLTHAKVYEDTQIMNNVSNIQNIPPQQQQQQAQAGIPQSLSSSALVSKQLFIDNPNNNNGTMSNPTIATGGDTVPQNIRLSNRNISSLSSSQFRPPIYGNNVRT